MPIHSSNKTRKPSKTSNLIPPGQTNIFDFIPEVPPVVPPVGAVNPSAPTEAEAPFTENKRFIVREVDAKTARAMVREYHYSGKVVNNSRFHLGVYTKPGAIDVDGTEYDEESLVGVLSFGYPMNPDRTPAKLVEGSDKTEMFELNRMAMRDDAPKLSESQAIGLSIKFIKRFKPEIEWLLSFSDGKEGNVGTIYQATNWQYHGYRVSTSFFDLDGDIMHSVPVWNKFRQHDKTGRTTNQILFDHFENVSKIESRQHIYIMPLTKRVKKRIIPAQAEYPNKDTEPLITRRTVYKRNGVILPKPEIIVYGDDGGEAAVK